MNVEKKKKQVEKIQDDRIRLQQEIGWIFRPLALCPFPAQTLGKRTVIDKDGKEKQEYEIIWKRRSKNISVEILGHPDYGVPYGQDILLVLFLAIEARRQNTRKIRVNFYRDFMRLFDFNANDGRKYRLVIDSLNRVRHSKFTWEVEGEEDRQTGLHYMYIEEIDLYCSPKNPDQRPLFEQYILLSERFWDEINRHKIPFNLDSIKFLKSKPAHLNFYLWLSTRIGQLFVQLVQRRNEKKALFIPFWGDEGLQNQLSSVIQKRYEFRREVKKWLNQTKELWTLCPVQIEGDGLKIELTNVKQLDVQPDRQKLLGKSIRLEKASEKKIKKPCPECGETMELRKGITLENGQKLDDFFRCNTCQKNYYKKNFLHLYQ